VTTLTDLELTIELADFLEAQGEALRHPRAKEAAARALEEAQGRVAPALVYDWLPVEVVGRTHAQVGEVLLRLGHHADLLASAREAFVCVVTIGPALEERARELAAAGETFDSYVLGEVGVYAVGSTMHRAHRLVEEEAGARGWGVGAELAPGQLAGWDVGEQKLLCSLVDVASIGVHVTDAGMLSPQKSASLMVGAGPDYVSHEVRSPCEFCDKGDTCRYRH
jgi:hypothetical protein